MADLQEFQFGVILFQLVATRLATKMSIVGRKPCIRLAAEILPAYVNFAYTCSGFRYT